MEVKVTKGFYIGDIVPSDVDGPGTRAMIHFAGCSLACPGCFNPHTHALMGPGVWSGDAQSVARDMVAVSPLVSISGGEPTDQPEALYELLVALRDAGAESVVLFTGRRVEWLEKRSPVLWVAMQLLIDVVIDGPFIQARMESNQVMRGSSNQRIITLTDAYTEDDFRDRDVQVLVEGDRLVVTGFPDADLLEAFSLMAG